MAAAHHDPLRCKVSIAGWPEEVEKIGTALSRMAAQERLDVAITKAGSKGYYEFEPLLTVEAEGGLFLYRNVKVQELDRILEDLKGGRLCGSFHCRSLPFFGLEKRRMLRDCGVIDPMQQDERTDRRLTRLEGILQMMPSHLVEEAERAGFITAQDLMAFSRQEERHLICNAIDSTPGSVHGRLLIAGDPLRVVEGAAVLGHMVGAKRATFCISDCPDRLETYLETWLERARLPFEEYHVRVLPSMLPMREEDVLLAYLQTGLLMPRRDPSRSEFAVHIETLASLALLLEETSGIRTHLVTVFQHDSPRITIEVEEGIGLKEILSALYGDDPSMVVQFPAQTGVFLKGGDLEIPIKASCSVDVFPRDSFGPDVVIARLRYIHAQSCGVCLFCREGVYQMRGFFEDLLHGYSPGPVSIIKEISLGLREGSLCGIGRDASALGLSALRLFFGEQEIGAHLDWGM